MRIITRLSQETQYYKNITSLIGTNVKIQEIYKYEQYKRCSRVTKEMSRDKQEAWKKRTRDGLLEIHAFTVPLWSATQRIHKLQAPGYGRADPGKSELSNEWWGESQVAYIGKHVCFNKSES